MSILHHGDFLRCFFLAEDFDLRSERAGAELRRGGLRAQHREVLAQHGDGIVERPDVARSTSLHQTAFHDRQHEAREPA